MGHIQSQGELLKDIKDLILTHFGESGQGIHVEVKGDKVSLWGTVDTLAEKDFIAQRISRIEGVKELDNSLTVADDGKISDKEIEEWIRQRLAGSGHKEVSGLGCRVSHGIVTLLGHVETRSNERLARKIASQIRGVKEVRSEIQLKGKSVEDAELVNRVENALAASPWVNAQEIKTAASNGLVTLTGLVNTPDEVEWAVETAYQVAGVKAVVSEVLSRHHSQGEDLRLTEQLVNALGLNRLNSAQVHAYVQGGIAFLSGEVYSPEDRERAEILCQGISGIDNVDNSIRVAAHWSK
ncbi:periplasmic protein [Peptococcaceae bacterium CEB3]|nr:periplasmic protein [Peptococcaceae bacterium CEB3]